MLAHNRTNSTIRLVLKRTVWVYQIDTFRMICDKLLFTLMYLYYFRKYSYIWMVIYIQPIEWQVISLKYTYIQAIELCVIFLISPYIQPIELQVISLKCPYIQPIELHIFLYEFSLNLVSEMDIWTIWQALFTFMWHTSNTFNEYKYIQITSIVQIRTMCCIKQRNFQSIPLFSSRRYQ